MDKSAQRKAFEEEFAFPRSLSTSRFNDVYADELTQLPWEAWQAATEQARQPQGTLQAPAGRQKASPIPTAAPMTASGPNWRLGT